MSESKLPEHPSLEYLKKLAKDRLRELRRTDPQAKLAAALLSVARDHGFPSWRALKAEVERRQAGTVAQFFEACTKGDVAALRRLTAADSDLVHAANPAARHAGWTGLHEAARRGHLAAVRLLLDHGADPNAREAGDNTSPLHWAAACRHVEVVRALLDAGSDVQGTGDVHMLDTIGWATFFHEPNGKPGDRPEAAELLIEHGARHHIFSAMSIGNPNLVRTLVEQQPDALDRRMSRFEQGRSPLHFAIDYQRYDLVDLLIELGADVEATDLRGQTPLAAAMLRGDREAIRRLLAAGARRPDPVTPSSFREGMAKLADSVGKAVPMILVADVARSLEWYRSIGFTEVERYGEDGLVNFGMVAFGKAELMLNMHGKPGKHDASLWFYTDRVDELYQLLKARQLDSAQATLAGEQKDGVEFDEDIYDAFYGARQFSIRDPDGYTLYFIQLL